MSAVLKEAPKRNIVFTESRMKEREHKIHDYVLDVEVGVSVDDLLDPSAWAFLAPQLQPGDAIEVRPDDFSWFAFLRVVWAERNFARVILINVVKCEMNMEAPESSIKHEVRFKGGTLKWCVIRLSDQQAIQEGIASREAAHAWLKNYEVTTER